MSFLFTLTAFAADLKCEVCGMPIAEHARNHIILENETPGVKPMHVCSASCAHKARKHDPKYSKFEIADFNHPEKMIAGDKAYFLIQSSNIKKDMGPNVMAPFTAGFATKEEADAAKAKCGDGVVVQGAENAIK